jgi:hypothetical protein
MLQQLDESLEAFLRVEVPLPERTVDVVFEAPDGDWAAGISRPTVNLYLWDVRPNLSERAYGEEIVELADGTEVKRHPLPRVDCRFFVTAWTTDVRDEHQLLGDLLQAFLQHPLVDEPYLRGALADLRPLPRLQLRGGDASANSDFWSAVGGQLKPGLDVTVTAVVDASLAVPIAARVQEGGLDVVGREKKPPSPRKPQMWPDPQFPR